MDKQNIKVLLIEDDPEDVYLIKKMLSGYDKSLYGFELKDVNCLSAGLDHLAKTDTDIALLDLCLPDSDGIETLRSLYAEAPDIPIVILTGFSDEAAGIEAVKAGAQDYLLKGQIDSNLLYRALVYAIERKRADTTIQSLKQQNLLLQEEILEKTEFEAIIGEAPAMLNVYETIRIVSRTDSSVIVYGETGTGKELVVNAIHNLSRRNDRPLVKINCAAIPETLLESELFGYEKGAFTGAFQRRKGKFEVSDSGTIFLDEIGEMPSAIQSKLLRILENRTFERLGSNESITIDVRLIYATSKDLLEEVRAGRFREDLYYRINTVPIMLPPLRERKTDIPMLASYFLDHFSRKFDKTDYAISVAAMKTLLAHDYPGNVRELKHAIETAVIMSRNKIIGPDCIPFAQKENNRGGAGQQLDYSTMTLAEGLSIFEKELVRLAVRGSSGSRVEAAMRLGISRATLWRKMQEYGISESS